MDLKKSLDFIGLLDAAEAYFKDDSGIIKNMPASQIDTLKAQLLKQQSKTQEIRKDIESMHQEYGKLIKYIEEQKRNKETLEKSISSLKSYNSQLIHDIQTADLTLKNLKSSLSCSYLSEISRTQQPSPIPIKYKPISKRSHRTFSDKNKP